RESDAPADKLPEIEIYEYHLLQQQLTWLRSRYPDSTSINGLDSPMVSGPEVITCDNTTYQHTLVDADRSGLIFSVPFFGPDENIKGSVSAIILSSALRALLPTKDFSLVNPAYGYASLPSADGQERASVAWAEKGKPDPSLIYSSAIALPVSDPRSQWS